MSKAKTVNKQIEVVAKRAAEVLAQLEAMKPLYNEIDKLTEELREAGITNIVVGTTVLQIVDNFASKNTMFKPTAFKRFELKKVA